MAHSTGASAAKFIIFMVLLGALFHFGWIWEHIENNHVSVPAHIPVKRQQEAVDILSEDVRSAPTAAGTVKDTHADKNTNDVVKDTDVAVAAPLSLPNRTVHSIHKYGNRIYCMVPFYWHGEERRNHYETIMTTWGPRCDVIKFFADESTTQGLKLPENMVRLKTSRPTMCGGRPCRHIWEKVWRMIAWTAENEAHLGDWFCKVDEDAIIFPENVKSFVAMKHWNPKDNYYFGHMLYNRLGDAKIHFIAGANAFYSYGALTGITPHYRTMPFEHRGERGICADRDGATEEITTAVCFRDKLNLTASTTMNEYGQERVMLFYPKAHLNHMKEREEWGWYWKNKPAHAGVGPDCCARDPIAFHGYKRWQEMIVMDDMIRGSRGLMEEMPLTRAYLCDVRKSLGVDLEIFLKKIQVSSHAWPLLRDESIRDYESVSALSVTELAAIGLRMGDASKIVHELKSVTKDQFYAEMYRKNTTRGGGRSIDSPVPRATRK
eukprot:m.127576 g.127576  ORF g.127576 m.127576 type:complete len:492 (+) comp29284_c0_seq2:291-1766(+)